MRDIDEPKKRSMYTIEHLEKKKAHFADAFSDEERPFVERRWNDLKEHIGWKNKHYREYHKLKTLRVDEAHP